MPSALTPAGSTPAVVTVAVATVAAGNWRPLPFSDFWSHSWARREREKSLPSYHKVLIPSSAPKKNVDHLIPF